MPRTFGVAAGALLGVVSLHALAASALSVTSTHESGLDARVVASYRRPAAIPFPEENAYSAAKAELGRRLFFDPILSGPRTRSCASCHVPSLAWADGRARAATLGDTDMALRTPSLLNVAWVERLGWDGKFPTLEGVAFKPITAKANMGLPEAEAIKRLSADAEYRAAFAAAYPAEKDTDLVTRGRIEDALATFQRMLVSEPAPFDRWLAGETNAVSASAKKGFALFNGKAGCAACHSGFAFSDGSFHDVGVGKGEDIGRGRYFPGSVGLAYAFKTPTLRDVARRAPYMHDGSMRDLAAVIELYDRGGIERPSRSRDIRPLHLTVQEKADLLAFLETLTGPDDGGRAMAPMAAAPFAP